MCVSVHACVCTCVWGVSEGVHFMVHLRYMYNSSEENLVISRKRRSKELKMSRMKFSTGERNTRDLCWSTGKP